MNKNKKIICLAFFLPTFLISCGGRKIPEGPIKDLLDSFRVEKAIENVKNAKLESLSIDTENGKEIGRIKTSYEFSVENNQYYLYRHQSFSGNYVVNDLKEFQVLIYSLDKQNNTFFHKTIRNDQLDDTNLLKNQVENKITKFFYMEESSGFHSGGQYYGDALYVNGYRYYMNLTINEQHDILTYKLVNDATYEGFIINQEYSVNNFGMLLNYYTNIEDLKNGDITTTINIEYNTILDKKNNI